MAILNLVSIISVAMCFEIWQHSVNWKILLSLFYPLLQCLYGHFYFLIMHREHLVPDSWLDCTWLRPGLCHLWETVGTDLRAWCCPIQSLPLSRSHMTSHHLCCYGYNSGHCFCQSEIWFTPDHSLRGLESLDCL